MLYLPQLRLVSYTHKLTEHPDYPGAAQRTLSKLQNNQNRFCAEALSSQLTVEELVIKAAQALALA